MSSSLAAKSGAVALMSDTTDIEPKQTAAGSSYVTIISIKSSKFSDYKQDIKDLADGDVVLVRPDESPVKLSPFRWIFVNARRLWANFDDNYEFTKVVFEDPGKSKELKESVESVMLVIGRSHIVPARCSWHKARLPAVNKAVDAFEAVKDASKWALLSQEHAFAVKHAPNVKSRFVVTTRTYSKTFDNGRKGFGASSTISPITAAELTMLEEWNNYKGSAEEYAAVMESYNERMKAYESCA